MVSNLISETDWSDKYRADTTRFVNSLIKYAKSRKTLSKKQMYAAVISTLGFKKILKKMKKKKKLTHTGFLS